jgi:hypothetical protein
VVQTDEKHEKSTIFPNGSRAMLYWKFSSISLQKLSTTFTLRRVLHLLYWLGWARRTAEPLLGFHRKITANVLPRKPSSGRGIGLLHCAFAIGLQRQLSLVFPVDFWFALRRTLQMINLH